MTKKVRRVLLVLMFFGVSAYVVLQAGILFGAPKLEIIEPKSRVVRAEDFVNVVGKAEPGNTVKINNESVPIDDSGYFSVRTFISPGSRGFLEVSASNRTGKKSVKFFEIISEARRSEEKIDF